MGVILLIGYLFTFILIGLFVHLAWKIVSLHLLSKSKDLKQYGRWAVVTGATDGIGKAYAVELAKRGLDVLILGRNQGRLQAATEEIETAAPDVVVESYEIDFSDVSLDNYQHLADKLGQMDIGILVNNVGVSYDHPEHVHLVENGLEFFKKLIEVNCVPVTLLSRIVLPSMLKKRKGVIVNVSSSLANFFAGFMSGYCATKAYVQSLTLCLQQEYRDTGVDIQCVSPFYVASKMSKIRRSSFFVPSSEEYAANAIKTIGNASFTYGCLSHSILGYLTELVVPPILGYYSTKSMKTSRDIYLKKFSKSK